jgi:ppGpp synthetase/RelA/SpoT-type nucleotidyltranferase
LNLTDYEQRGEGLYGEFAALIKFILERAIGASDAPQPQSILLRAKSAASLKKKLEQQGLLDSDSIEETIKDLAGVRLIFYTNTDVDRFLNSGLIRQGFVVDWKETRIHHPTSENAEQRYHAIHFTVSLSEERTALPEYAKFNGLRCEIPIQTILNHAWAETSHDILYKANKAKGFGSKVFRSIEKRMARVMDEYLLPAGYELQKVQHDYKRLMQGKALFERGTLEVLAQCKDNNERFDTLSTIREYVLPNYDDPHGIFGDLCDVLLESVPAARACADKPIETPFGSLPGKTAKDVTSLVIEIFDDLRYLDIERTFRSLAALYRDEDSSEVRNQILHVVEHLAQYDINVWQRVGPQVQHVLAEMLAGLSPEECRDLRPLLLKVWRVLLSPQIRGTTQSSMEAFTIRTGSLPASNALVAIRDRAITGLFESWDQSSTVAEQQAVFSALMEATSMPIHGDYSNELCATILKDTKKIVDALDDRLSGKPYGFIEHVEHRFLFHYHLAKQIAENERDGFGCKDIASSLMTSLLAIRDRLNTDEKYVRYKTLVGFETVLPPHWEDREFEFRGAQEFRNQRAMEYVDAISEATEDDWYQLIVLCATTESVDLATFPVFSSFLAQLAKVKPATMLRFLKREDPHLARFLVAILEGLSESSSKDDYHALIKDFLSRGKHLWAIARHFQFVGAATPAEVEELVDKAIGASDDFAVIQCLILSIKLHESQELPLIDSAFVPAIRYDIAHKDARWVNEVWFLREGKPFFISLSAEHANLTLEALFSLPHIDHGAEAILAYVAETHSRAVWAFFGRRLKRDEDPDGKHYEAFPYTFHDLQEPLARDAESAIASVRSWFRDDDLLFRFRGGRLLATVFLGFPDNFAARLREMAQHGTDEDLNFILAVMQNYHGEPATHALLQDIVDRLPEGDSRLGKVEISLRSTGGVVGEFGMVEAFKRKKEEVRPWLEDPRPRVKAFATEYMRHLEGNIAAEQRKAEEEHELRKRDFEAYADP